MSFKSFKLTIVGLFLVTSSFIGSVNATLISDLSERDWQVAGDGGVTYDRSTGLEWLDLSYTLGNTIVETESESFFTSGEFRWATVDEVNNLIDAVINGPVGSLENIYSADVDLSGSATYVPLTNVILDNAETFRDLLGETPDPTAHDKAVSVFTHGTSREFGYTHGNPLVDFYYGEVYSVSYVQYTEDTAQNGGAKRVRVLDAHSRGDALYTRDIQVFDNMGSWLVRDTVTVPEPSTFAIFALGLIGLASRRFKK